MLKMTPTTSYPYSVRGAVHTKYAVDCLQSFTVFRKSIRQMRHSTLGRIRQYHQRSAFADPDSENRNQRFLGARLPMPDIEREVSQVCIAPRTVESVVDPKRGKGPSSPFNVRFRVRFRGAGPNSDGGYRRRQTPHCHKGIRAYLAKVQESSPESQMLTPAPPV